MGESVATKMWTRKELKERAKAVLKKIYWKAFLISIVIALAGGKAGDLGHSDSRRSVPPDLTEQNTIMAGIAVFLVIAALRIMVGYSLEVGGRRYFIQSAQDNDNKRCFRFAFEWKNYVGIILTMLLRGVQNILWFFLLIVPGIVKYYAYRMVPYILADNPNIGSKKAIKLSIKMTKGHKFAMFVLDLSFIGWYLLGMLALLVGVLFVMPYENATNAELYIALRKNALENNWCSNEDLLLDSAG